MCQNMKTILVFLVSLSALTTRADELYIAQVNSVLAISPGIWQQFVREETQGDKATCQQMVGQSEAIYITQAAAVYLIRVQGDLAQVRLKGSSELLWTSVNSIKKN
jgi:hypothetical protein